MDINKICPGCMHEIENRESVAKCPHCGYDFSHTAADPHQLQPFTILAGKYLVGRVIGEGGFGISYLGYDLNLEMIVAIKEFYPNGFVTRESNHSTQISMYSGKNEADVTKWRESFINEARNLARFSNLNGIVEVRDFFNENNTAYIVMEYIDGMTLKQYLKKNGGKIPVDKTLEMMEPVIRSLSKVHDAGIIHRDISPDNIMITAYGGMKLLDFGAARDFAGNAEKSLSIMLKPGYAPEEQYRSRGKQGPWSDVYALTATIYKCITGVTPVESMERMREDSLKMPSELGVKLTKEQEAAIRQGMAVYAEDRIQSMDALHMALYSGKNPYEMAQQQHTNPLADIARKVETGAKAGTADGPRTSTGTGVKMPNVKMPNVTIPESSRKPILIGIAAVCCVVLIAVCAALMPSGKDKDTKNKKSSASASSSSVSSSAQQDTSASYATSSTLAEQYGWDYGDSGDAIDDRMDSIDNAVSDYSNLEEIGNALDAYLVLAEEYGNKDGLGERVYQMFSVYAEAVKVRVNNCNQQEPSAALYIQMTSDLGNAMEYVRQFEEYGIGVNAGELETMETEIRSGYKARLIENFDSYAQSEISNNGVVSRSELWSKIEGVNETDLYDANNPDDPLRLRYAAALTLHTDSELESLEDVGSRIGKVYEVLLDADYNPLLIYYLSEEYGDYNAYPWYQTYCALDGDIGSLSDADRKNFVYYYCTNSAYQSIRQSYYQYMSEEL